MKRAPLLKFLFIGALCSLGANLAFADDTPAAQIPQPTTTDVGVADVQRAYFQLQQEIQATQLALERSQQDAQAAVRRAIEDMTARFQLLEESLNTQRAGELAAMQRMNHVVLVVAGAFVALVFIALLFISYFQWRVAHRLAELSSVRPSLLTMASSRALSDGGQSASNQAVEQANARLLGVVDQLQRRILEFEKAARAPLKENIRPTPARVGKV
ncbi:MAG: hypothetical protein HY298_24350 [Verrucomicrobia bacterium]|nr:hypothetical protein [Verrucomicrobiota bacterium]